MLKKILIGLGALIAILLVVISLQPSTYHVERSLKVAAPASAVFPALDDLKAWAAWSPWDKLDPQMKKTFGGPPQGVGSTYAWAGNDQVGKGQMTITESVKDTKVTYKLEFLEPFASTATTSIALAPAGAETTVTWSMDGTNDFMGKAFGLVMNMDKMIGADFERGLANLRPVAEANAKQPVATP